MTRVLIVRDDPSLLHLADVLRAQGYVVEVVPESLPALVRSPESIRLALHEEIERQYAARRRK